MHPALEKLLKKRGINELKELSVEEKGDFDRWQRVLSEGDVTVERIAEFCRHQIKQIESKWRDLKNTKDENDRLVLIHTVYSVLLDAITAPKAEREGLEKYLNQLLDT